MKKQAGRWCVVITCCVLLVLGVCVMIGTNLMSKNKPLQYEDNLYTPTMIQKIESTYFIVDCWHNRVIYSDHLNIPIEEWDTLCEVYGGHTIAYDGRRIVIDDTDRDRLLVYEKLKGGWTEVQVINIKDYLPANYVYRDAHSLVRPHFVMYDNEVKKYLVTLSWGDAIMVLSGDEALNVDGIYTLPAFDNSYLKFISKMDGLYWVAGADELVGFTLDEKGITEVKSVTLPNDFKGQINNLTKIGQVYYMSTWEDKGLYCFDTLEDIENKNIINVGIKTELKGIPYNITYFDNYYWLTGIVSHQEILKFHVDEDTGVLTESSLIYKYSDLDEFDEERKLINNLFADIQNDVTNTNIKYNKLSNTLDVYYSDNGEYEKMWIPVWSEEDGQDDLIWYEAVRSDDKTWKISIDLLESNATGLYNIHYYQGHGKVEDAEYVYCETYYVE